MDSNTVDQIGTWHSIRLLPQLVQGNLSTLISLVSLINLISLI